LHHHLADLLLHGALRVGDMPRRDLLIAVGAAGDLPARDTRAAGLVAHADPGLRAGLVSTFEGLARLQAARSARGVHADHRLPAIPERRAWWNTPTRGSVLAWWPPSRVSPACRLIDATVVNTQTFACPVWNRSRSASTSNRPWT